jgi:PleD family two-component response regulator
MAGDLVLKTLAKILIQKLKAEDLQVRWGGEEF